MLLDVCYLWGVLMIRNSYCDTCKVNVSWNKDLEMLYWIEAYRQCRVLCRIKDSKECPSSWKERFPSASGPSCYRYWGFRRKGKKSRKDGLYLISDLTPFFILWNAIQATVEIEGIPTWSPLFLFVVCLCACMFTVCTGRCGVCMCVCPCTRAHIHITVETKGPNVLPNDSLPYMELGSLNPEFANQCALGFPCLGLLSMLGVQASCQAYSTLTRVLGIQTLVFVLTTHFTTEHCLVAHFTLQWSASVDLLPFPAFAVTLFSYFVHTECGLDTNRIDHRQTSKHSLWIWQVGTKTFSERLTRLGQVNWSRVGENYMTF